MGPRINYTFMPSGFLPWGSMLPASSNLKSPSLGFALSQIKDLKSDPCSQDSTNGSRSCLRIQKQNETLALGIQKPDCITYPLLLLQKQTCLVCKDPLLFCTNTCLACTYPLIWHNNDSQWTYLGTSNSWKLASKLRKIPQSTCQHPLQHLGCK